jgi:hypothetical protein
MNSAASALREPRTVERATTPIFPVNEKDVSVICLYLIGVKNFATNGHACDNFRCEIKTGYFPVMQVQQTPNYPVADYPCMIFHSLSIFFGDF